MREIHKIKKLFYLAITLTLLILSANHLLINGFMNSQDHAAAMINISGKQRMLSQSAAMWTEKLVDSKSPEERERMREKITQIADEIIRSHTMLVDANSHIGAVTHSSDKLMDIYFAEPVILDRQVKKFVQHLRHIVKEPDKALNESNKDRNFILQESASNLLVGFEKAVVAYQDTNTIDLKNLSVLSTVLTASIFCGVGGLWLFIFKPMIRSVSDALRITEVQQEVASAANEAMTVEEGLRAGINAICNYTGWQIGHAYLYSENEAALTSLDVWHLTKDVQQYEEFIRLTEKMTFSSGQGFIGEVYKDAVPMWIMELADSPVYMRKDAILKTGMKSAFAFPIFVGRKVKAVLEFYSTHAEVPDEMLFQLMQNIGKQLGQVIERAQFHEKAKLLETVISSANDGIIITNAALEKPGPQIIYVNKAFSKITGYKPEEVIGKSPRILQGDGTDKKTLRNMYGELKEGRAFKGEVLNYDTLGKPYWLDISIVPVRDGEGNITHFAAIERDITERKSSEKHLQDVVRQLKRANLLAEASARDLQDSLYKAEEASKAKSDFLANMSHELRTPMNGVLGMAHLLEDTALTDEQKQFVSTINGSAENLLMLLNDILDFSKIEAGALDLEHIAYGIKDTIEKTVQLLHPQAEKKSVELIFDFEQDVPQYVWGDPGRIRQVITNLISNAIKFTNKGHVRVSVREMEYSDTSKLYITVEDTGMGIPAEKLLEIFEKFTQGDASVTRKYGGTGLGLAITKQLVLLMGGEIGVESAEGKGSTFWISLPLLPANPEDATSAKEHHTIYCQATEILKPIHEARALLVEDYHVNQVFAEKLLRKFGFNHIDITENGVEALRKYRTNPYDIIFMDCQMPELDGYQTTQKLRLIEQDTPIHTPIIAMTANAMMGDREKCLKSGMDDYLSKPLRAEHLKKVLKIWFELDELKSAVSKHNTSSVIQLPQPVDIEQLRMFTDGDPDEEKELIQLFLDQAQEMIDILESNTSEHGKDAWKSAAHRFKGSSGNLGAMQLHHLCKRAENHFEDSDMKKTEMLCAIKRETSNVREFFNLS